MVKARQWTLVNKPRDIPTYQGSDATFQLSETDIPEPKDDEVLVKLVYLSNDPAQRGWISPEANEERLYVAPAKTGAPMPAGSICQVVSSKSANFKEGDWVQCQAGWTEYAVFPAKQLRPLPELEGGLSRTHYLGALGGTGLTAYFGMLDVGAVTKDDIVVISGAAGATGSMCVQIAKHLVGCKKIIGIAGSDSKCRWVESLGADLCLNYKSKTFKQDLEKATAGPDAFANVYYDNVGGEILDLMFTRMARHGRIVACGAIANYNSMSDRMTGLKNWFEVIQMRLQIKGFIVIDFLHRAGEAQEAFRKLLKEGKLQIEGGEQVVKGSFEDIPKTWLKLFEGSNQGKLVTEVVQA